MPLVVYATSPATLVDYAQGIAAEMAIVTRKENATVSLMSCLLVISVTSQDVQVNLIV